MVEELATVTQINNNNLVVESIVKSACSGCQQVDSCASGQVAKAIPHRKLVLNIDSQVAVKIGENVIIGIPETKLLSTAMQVYFWPLFGLILFSAAGQFFVQQGYLPNEISALLLGLFGGLIGHKVAKRRLSRQQTAKALQPILLRKVSQTISVT